MRPATIVAICTPDDQNDLLAALHGRNAGHLVRVLRADRDDITAQVTRIGLDTALAPTTLAEADRAMVINAAHRATEIGWLLLQRGATSVWLVTGDGAWCAMDDMPLEVSPAAGLPPMPMPMPTAQSRAERAFRPTRHRRRPRYAPEQVETGGRTGSRGGSRSTPRS